MDSCGAVEKEIDRVLSKFNDINENSRRVLRDLITHLDHLRNEFESGKSSKTFVYFVINKEVWFFNL